MIEEKFLESMNTLISKIFDVLKSPKLLIWTALTSALFLYIPASFVPYRGYQDLKDQYGIWMFLILIGCISMLAIEFGIYIHKFVKKKTYFNQNREKIKNRLESLSDNEKSIIREFDIQGQRLIKMPIDNPYIVSLTNDGIIKLSKRIIEFHLGNPLGLFSVTETASEFITEELLGFPQEGPTTENIERIQRLRPYWAVEIEHKDRIWGR